MGLFTNESEKSAPARTISEAAQRHDTARFACDAAGAQHSRAAFHSGRLVGSDLHLDRGTKISGKLRFEGPARIDGTIDEEIDGKEITIGESAVATAQIRADSIVVCGKVKGELTATNRIEIRNRESHRQYRGAEAIIHEGAIFEGQCSMGHEADRDRKVRAVS